MSLDTLVSVTISKLTATASRTGFGIPLILTFHTKDSARTLSFTSAPDMLVAGGGPFAVTDAAYILANAAFSQNPKPDRILIGRREEATIRTVILTPRSGVINGLTHPLNTTLYRVTINGTNFDFTTDATATVAEITAGLASLINAGAENVLATDNTTSMTIEKAVTPGGTATAGVQFIVDQDRTLFAIEDTTPAAAGGSLADEIAAISVIDDDWYGITGDWYGAIEIQAVATAIEGLAKLHASVAPDDEIYDAAVTDDLGSNLQTTAFARTFLFHHPTPETGIAAAQLGNNLPNDPGSITWKFKTLAGIATVNYTATEELALQNKNVERYVTVAGLNITCDGKTSSGEFIDVTRFIDFITARMQEAIFTRIKNLKKLPYTNKGIAVVESEIRGVLRLGISVGGLAEDPPFEVTVPNAIVGSENGVSATDKANRILSGITFCATLAGAIHEISISGKVTP